MPTLRARPGCTVLHPHLRCQQQRSPSPSSAGLVFCHRKNASLKTRARAPPQPGRAPTELRVSRGQLSMVTRCAPTQGCRGSQYDGCIYNIVKTIIRSAGTNLAVERVQLHDLLSQKCITRACEQPTNHHPQSRQFVNRVGARPISCGLWCFENSERADRRQQAHTICRMKMLRVLAGKSSHHRTNVVRIQRVVAAGAHYSPCKEKVSKNSQ